ncbi:MAG: methyltransferase domain-containing protein [Acidimicrobiia bacterium]|nr:methyltransferase domain-containing protein [Acidimicrobiia bacterium]
MATMTGVMNGGALALMCSIGHKTGLFDTMAQVPPSTAAEVAAAAGLDERYVREWLGAMVTGGVVEHDPDAGTYRLPAEHSGLLTRAAGPLNLTTFCQYVSLLGEVEDEIVDAFRNGGGVPYDRYPRFHRLMAESSGQRIDRTLLSEVLPLLPGGAEPLVAGIDVADVGCGSGRALNLLAANFPASRFTGYDLSEAAIGTGRAQAGEEGLTNVEFVVQDAATLSAEASFDLVTTFDAIHDQAFPDAVLSGIARALRPGGTYLCVEPKASSHLHENLELPMAPFFYTMSTMHCMTVSLAYGGEGLGAVWGRQLAEERLAKAGFVDVVAEDVREDRTNTYFVARRAG